MVENGTLATEIIPEYVWEAVKECEDPMNQQISNKDLTALMDAYQHYLITTHKQPRCDKVMRLHHAELPLEVDLGILILPW